MTSDEREFFCKRCDIVVRRPGFCWECTLQLKRNREWAKENTPFKGFSHDQLRYALSLVPEIERRFLKARFGIDSDFPETLSASARACDVASTDAAALQQRALELARDAVKEVVAVETQTRDRSDIVALFSPQDDAEADASSDGEDDGDSAELSKRIDEIHSRSRRKEK